MPIDYQVPKILEYWKVLKYSKDLKHKIDNNIQILKNSEEEIAIRSASILSTNIIMKEFNITSLELDNILIIEAKK